MMYCTVILIINIILLILLIADIINNISLVSKNILFDFEIDSILSLQLFFVVLI